MGVTARFVRVAAAATIAGTIAWGAPADAQPRTYQYTINEHKASESFTEAGICAPGDAQITLTGVNSVTHVSATEAGLTEEQVLDLLESDDPDGIITKVTHTGTGKFTTTESDGTVYTGRFTFWFGGAHNRQTDVFTGTFNATGANAAGDHVTFSFVGHVTVVDGELVREFEKGFVKGCPEA